jgi:hypothetical protein
MLARPHSSGRDSWRRTRTVPSAKLRSISQLDSEKARFPISRTLPGIRTLLGAPKQQNTFPSRTTKPALNIQSEEWKEVTPDCSNAEAAMVVTESGRLAAKEKESRNSC